MQRMLTAYLLLCILSLILFFAIRASVCGFDPDEFQHLETAWLIATGYLPYKDFFEHHTPLYHYLISPLLTDTALMTSGNAAVEAVLTLRYMAVALGMGIVGMTILVARKLTATMDALYASILLCSSIVFILKGVEIRPDQLAALLLLSATLLLLTAKTSSRWLLHCAFSGALAALAVLTTQKTLLAMPGIAVTLYWVSVSRKTPSGELVRGALFFLIGGAIAASPVFYHFWRYDALSDFVTNNFLLVSKWPHIPGAARSVLRQIIQEDGLLLLLIGTGIVDSARQPRHVLLQRAAVIAPCLSMMFFIPFFPVVQRQYIFLFMPYLAILGGIGAATWVRVISQHKDIVLPGLMLCSVVTLHGIVLARLDLTGEYTHEETLAKLRYIVDRTDTSAAVMSSWSPGVTFRKPAFFYPALNPEIRSVIPKEAYEKLVNEIRNKTTVPEIVDMDTDMEQMPPELLALLKNKWEPVGVATLWRHRHD